MPHVILVSQKIVIGSQTVSYSLYVFNYFFIIKILKYTLKTPCWRSMLVSCMI